jgi:hypothetical protein
LPPKLKSTLRTCNILVAQVSTCSDFGALN